MNRTFARLSYNPTKNVTHRCMRNNFSTSRCVRNTVVLADHDNKVLSPGTLNAITCAKAIGKPVDVLVLGHECTQVVESCANIEGVRQVFYANHEGYLNPTAENQTPAILKQVKEGSYTHVLAPASSNGKNVLPRVAAILDVQPISEIQSVISEDTFVRPIYAGNALQTLQSMDKVKVITVRTTAFPAAPKSTNTAPITHTTVPPSDAKYPSILSRDSQRSERPDLTSADRVVSGGRALKSAENFSILYALADKLNAAVGASRAAVDAGFAPNDMQVGQTGKVVAPSLYIAVGISGAIQHLAGMKDSKVIVAVNSDPEAPIFQVADYGLVGDLFKVIPELTDALKK